MAEPPSLVLGGVTLPDGRLADVAVSGDRISAVTEPAGPVAAEAGTRVELRDYLLLPAPAEPHVHLDKVLTAGLIENATGDLEGAVESWYRFRATAPHRDIADRALEACLRMLGHGCTAVRTHLDVGTRTGLRFLDAVVAAREELRGRLHLEIAAFVDVPSAGPAGAGNLAVLAEAMERGADVVGGAPYRDPDPLACQEELLAVAARHGAPVDLHTDETLDESVSCLGELAAQVTRSGFPHRVTASHCVSLGVQAPDRVRRIGAGLAAAGIGVVCCPATNLYLQGRDHPVATPRGLTALAPLAAAGVTVAGGGDNIQDPFNPLGRGDPLDTAVLLVLAGHLPVEAAYAAVSEKARWVLGLPEVRIAPGFPAELLAIPAGSLRTAVADRDPRRVVVHCGRIVAGPHRPGNVDRV